MEGVHINQFFSMFDILYSMMTIHVREDPVTVHQKSGGTSILGGSHNTVTQILN